MKTRIMVLWIRRVNKHGEMLRLFIVLLYSFTDTALFAKILLKITAINLWYHRVKTTVLLC